MPCRRNCSAAVKELLPDLGISLGPRTATPIVGQLKNDTASENLSLIQVGGQSSGGSSGSSSSGGSANAGATGIETEAAPVTTLIVSGAPWTVERGIKLLEQLDKPCRQIHIAATVTEVNRDDLTQLGIDWTDLGPGVPFGFGEPLENDITTTWVQNPATGQWEQQVTATPDPKLMRNLTVGHIMRTPIQWVNELHALEQKGNARILSNPSVTVLDGRQTALHTGDTILYNRISAVSNGTPVYTTDEKDVGVTLTVNPRSNENGEVTLTLLPSVSSITGWVNGLPQTTERAVATTVRVKSGETAVIAGLVSDEDHKSVSQVPFLGQLPVLGELFKYRRTEPSHTEILIFVTPTICD